MYSTVFPYASFSPACEYTERLLFRFYLSINAYVLRSLRAVQTIETNAHTNYLLKNRYGSSVVSLAYTNYRAPVGLKKLVATVASYTLAWVKSVKMSSIVGGNTTQVSQRVR